MKAETVRDESWRGARCLERVTATVLKVEDDMIRFLLCLSVQEGQEGEKAQVRM